MHCMFLLLQTVPVSALGALSTRRMNNKTFGRNEYETNDYVSITIEVLNNLIVSLQPIFILAFADKFAE